MASYGNDLLKGVTEMSFNGILIAVVTFFLIGLFHPIVIKCEYYFSDKVWPVFFVIGLIMLAVSCFFKNIFISCIFGVIGCSCLWSVFELKEQKKRVEKGWFPKNKKRK